MKLATILSAIALPVLAMAQEDDASTTTSCTSTTTTTTTTTITNWHTVYVSESAVEPTVSDSESDSPEPTAAESGDDSDTEPTAAGAALDAGRVAFAGLAGMIVVAFM